MIKGSIHHPHAGFAGMKTIRVITPQSFVQDQVQSARGMRSWRLLLRLQRKPVRPDSWWQNQSLTVPGYVWNCKSGAKTTEQAPESEGCRLQAVSVKGRCRHPAKSNQESGHGDLGPGFLSNPGRVGFGEMDCMYLTSWDGQEPLWAKGRVLWFQSGMSPKAHVSKGWSPACGAIGGGVEPLKGWA